MVQKIVTFDVALKSTERQWVQKIPEVYTNDLGSVSLQFRITDCTDTELTGSTAMVLLKMRDGSFFQGPSTDVTRTLNVFSYTLKENEGNHAGLAEIQLIVTIGAKEFATQKYNFKVITGLDSEIAREIMIYDWTTLTAEARAYIDQFTADELLRDAEFDNNQFDRNVAFNAAQTQRVITFNSSEAARVSLFNSKETARAAGYDADHAQALLDQSNYAGLLEDGVLTTQITAKLTELESAYTPDLFSVKQQLADKVGAGVKAEPEDLSATTLGLVTGTGGPINLLSVPQADSVTHEKLGADLKNKVLQIFERLKSLTLSVGGNVPTVNLIGNILTGKTTSMSQYFTLDTSNQGTFVSGRKYKVVLKYNNQSAFNVNFDVRSFVYRYKDGIAFGATAPASTTTGFEFDYTAVDGGDLSIIMYGDGVRDFFISAFVYDITDIDTAITDNIDFLALGTRDEIIIKCDYVRVAETAKEIAQSEDITCWGDSLTEGAGGGGTTIPIVLASLSGRTVRNMGIGGESTVEISARQGGVPAIVNPVTIPASGSVAITLQNSTIGHQGNFAGINPCKINGIEGNLTWNGSTLLFNRFVDGAVVEVTHPTALQTFAMQHYRDDIVVIYMGTNGGWQKTTSDGDINLLKSQINRMINYLTSINKRYIVVGLHYYQDWFNATREEIETAMAEEYGRNYINIREYIVNYGLQDAGLTATAEDTAALALGNVPPSLLSDLVHYNSFGYPIIGNQIHKRMVELGIL